MKRKALFLDKDGVINVDHGYVCTPERTDFIKGVFELCSMSTRLGFMNVVVTNQAGIGRGYYTEAEFLGYMDWVRGEFRKRGAQLDAVYYCPHHPVHGLGRYLADCDCRKPRPGMLLAAQRELGLAIAECVLVGDKPADIQAGEAAGVRDCILVEVRSGQQGDELDPECVQRVLRALSGIE